MKFLILDGDPSTREFLARFLEAQADVNEVVVAESVSAIQDDSLRDMNAIFVDVFDMQAEAVPFIERVRVRFPILPFVLWTKSESMSNGLVLLPPEYQKRFLHYYRLFKDSQVHDFTHDARMVLSNCLRYSTFNRAKSGIERARKEIEKAKSSVPDAAPVAPRLQEAGSGLDEVLELLRKYHIEMKSAREEVAIRRLNAGYDRPRDIDDQVASLRSEFANHVKDAETRANKHAEALAESTKTSLKLWLITAVGAVLLAILAPPLSDVVSRFLVNP